MNKDSKGGNYENKKENIERVISLGNGDVHINRLQGRRREEGANA